MVLLQFKAPDGSPISINSEDSSNTRIFNEIPLTQWNTLKLNNKYDIVHDNNPDSFLSCKGCTLMELNGTPLAPIRNPNSLSHNPTGNEMNPKKRVNTPRPRNPFNVPFGGKKLRKTRRKSRK